MLVLARRFRHRAALPCAVLAALIAPLLAPAGAGAQSARPWNDGDYWALADEISARLDESWGERSNAYRTPNNQRDTRLNGSMLAVHSAAALMGHEGPARNDVRVVELTRTLISPGAFVLPGTKLPKEAQAHAPGWNAVVSPRVRQQHASVDARVAHALSLAWRAAGVVEMPADLRDLVRDRIAIVARSRFHRFPRLNQFNWSADLQAARATVTGGRSPLRRDYAKFLRAFLAHARVPAARGWAANLNAGFGLVYSPRLGRNAPINRVAPSEYANVLVSGLMPLPAARAAGMRRLTRRQAAVLRAWQARVMFGDWTHAGYPNWDTGLGLARWHLVRYWAHAQSGLIAMAAGTGVSFDRRQGAWAKYLLDRSFELYRRWADPVELQIMRSHRWALNAPTAHSGSDPQHTAARFAASAASAVILGLGSRPSQQPPPWYARDPEFGRLAISTPAYSTAILRAAKGGYGGGELARLFGGGQQVLSNIGGTRSNAWGLRVRLGSRTLLETQPGGPDPPRRISGPSIGGRANRSTFRRLRATVRASGRWISAVTAHTFDRSAISVRRTLVARRRGMRAELRFPTWGSRATVRLLAPDGTESQLLAGERRRIARGTTLIVDGREGGYRARLLTIPRPATIHLRSTRKQPASPDPGPTAVVEWRLARGTTGIGYVLVP